MSWRGEKKARKELDQGEVRLKQTCESCSVCLNLNNGKKFREESYEPCVSVGFQAVMGKSSGFFHGCNLVNSLDPFKVYWGYGRCPMSMD